MRRASDLDDLVFHALAFVACAAAAPPASRAASLHWPAYVDWARAALPAPSWSFIAEDAPVLSAMLAPTPVAHAIALLAELHASVAELQRHAPRELAELGSAEVASPAVLDALLRLPREPVELLRADLALSAPAFAELQRAVLAPHACRLLEQVEGVMRDAGPRLSALDLSSVELSATLGLRGRGFSSRIVVGTGALPGSAPEPMPTLALAVHERVVQLASDALCGRGRPSPWEDVEAIALHVERRLVAGTPIERAHGAWLDSLDLTGVSDLAASGLVEVCEALVRELDAARPRDKTAGS